MLSMLTGNASSNSAEQQFHGYASVSGKPLSFEQVWTASEYVEDPLTQILLANQNKPVEARIRHKVPVTFGLSVYYNLGKRWGIGTGLNYTKLASELHSGSSDNYIKGEQKVHYIGIPVQVNYNIIQKGRFTGYVTGGALVEKSVSGSITTSYVVNDEVKETSEEKLDHKPLSFSVNTAVGLQMKVVNRLGIYAEPGIGYHFKDENSPNTIYKEKPLHFNVKFGIRLLID
ncbi:PorT family protein [Chryseobacterium bernardetii]|nr:PorT family protein [Chryseobacterium bernardetii]